MRRLPDGSWEATVEIPIDIIETLEQDLGKPVVASTSAQIWGALNLMNIPGPIKGYGRLLEML